MVGEMSRRLNDLSPRFLPLAFEFLARLTEQGILVCIVDTRRTVEEQAANLRAGVSWTANSRHLTGEAIDVAPYEVYVMHGSNKLQWDGDHPVWKRIGQIGEGCGLVWGGRWRQRDFGHFEAPWARDTGRSA